MGGLSIKLLLLVIFLAALIPVTLVGWRELYGTFLEANAPTITIVEGPRGVGITPVQLVIKLSDPDSGLDEVVVRAKQKRQEKEILRQKLDGKKEAEITIPFNGSKSGLEEGTVFLQIRVFDRSFWSSKGEQNYSVEVDYRKPQIEPLSTQHNAREGGSQVVFYKAYDEHIAVSGVKVDGQSFIGFPAKGLDPAFTDPDVYVAIYAIPLTEGSDERKVKLFAEDRVGNGVSKDFYNKVAKRRIRDRINRINEQSFRSLVGKVLDENRESIETQLRSIGSSLTFQAEEGTLSRLVEEFQLLEKVLRPINESTLVGIAKQSRHEQVSEGAFLSQQGVVRGGFGEKLTYIVGKDPIFQKLRKHYLLGPTSESQQVFAANDGVVLTAEKYGVFGNTVLLDHGLGITSLYASMSEITVAAGDKVTIGDVLGTYGNSGLSERVQLYFQLRVHGVPVDPTEWLSKTWYQAHMTRKIEDAKRSLGIPVYEGF